MSPTVRRTLLGFLGGVAVFGGAGLLQSLRTGVSLGPALGPVAFIALIGGTVGGLAGPLVGQFWSHVRGRRRGPGS